MLSKNQIQKTLNFVYEKLPSRFHYDVLIFPDDESMIDNLARTQIWKYKNTDIEVPYLARLTKLKEIYYRDQSYLEFKFKNGSILPDFVVKRGQKPKLAALSTNPISINISRILHQKHLIYTYLHETGHLQGQKCRYKHYFNEVRADRIAEKLYNKYIRNK